jgi:hypothetical protein
MFYAYIGIIPIYGELPARSRSRKFQTPGGDAEISF